MSRPRSAGNRKLPENLYRKTDKRNGTVYFSYRDPRTGKFHGLGSDQDAAENDAKALNAAIYATLRSARLAAMVANTPDTVTLRRLGMRHLELCEKRELAANTIRSRKSQVNGWFKVLGADTPIGELDVTQFVKGIEGYEKQGKVRMALAMRTAAVEMWKDAMAEGWAEANIPDRTRQPVPKVMRSRLTLEAFDACYEVADKITPWLRNAMELALVTSQRREDVGVFEFRQAAGATAWLGDAGLHVIQQKTGMRLIIPTSVQIHNLHLEDVIKRCRDNIITRWMIHHKSRTTLSQPGDPVHINTITRMFTRAVKLAGVKAEPGKTLPTFHEIRSLSIRLYTDAYGPDFAQAIAGHKDAQTTAIYRDTRGAEWQQIKTA